MRAMPKVSVEEMAESEGKQGPDHTGAFPVIVRNQLLLPMRQELQEALSRGVR